MQNADWRRFNLVMTSSISRKDDKTNTKCDVLNKEGKIFRIEIVYAKPAVKSETVKCACTENRRL